MKENLPKSATGNFFLFFFFGDWLTGFQFQPALLSCKASGPKQACVTTPNPPVFREAAFHAYLEVVLLLKEVLFVFFAFILISPLHWHKLSLVREQSRKLNSENLQKFEQEELF